MEVPLDGQPPNGLRTVFDLTPQDQIEKAREAMSRSNYLESFAAVLDKETGAVIGIGKAHWYD
jgi:hypothetical protein